MIQEKLKLDGHYHISSHDDIGTSLQVSISLFFFEKYISADVLHEHLLDINDPYLMRKEKSQSQFSKLF